MAWAYKVIPFATTPPASGATRLQQQQEAAAALATVLNQYAAAGWEFVRVDTLAFADLGKRLDFLFFRAPA